ncbi:hypothetical protein TYRP_013791 [Tyrophagus putrescentiae]|nr:hypothetical protein TYRP_013791 [Tyrophagus putrescentiae]
MVNLQYTSTPTPAGNFHFSSSIPPLLPPLPTPPQSNCSSLSKMDPAGAAEFSTIIVRNESAAAATA